MVFKINQSVINKKKRSPLYVLLYISLLAALFSLPQKEQDFDWAKFLIIFGVVGAFSAGSNHTVSINAASLTSGMYIYRVVANSATDVQVATGTMTLLK